MKSLILMLAVARLIISVAGLSCNDTATSDEDNKSFVKVADTSNAAFMKEIDTFRLQTSAKISSNDSSIVSLKERIKHDKKEVKADYEKSIAELEQKNAELKNKMVNYKAEGKVKWKIFKTDFSKSMDELGKSFKDLTAKI